MRANRDTNIILISFPAHIIGSLYFLFILPLFMFPCCEMKYLSLSGFANTAYNKLNPPTIHFVCVKYHQQMYEQIFVYK